MSRAHGRRGSSRCRPPPGAMALIRDYGPLALNQAAVRFGRRGAFRRWDSLAAFAVRDPAIA